MSTTEIVALIVALCTAIGGPLAFYVSTSLGRIDKGTDRIVASIDKQTLSIEKQSTTNEVVASRLARIETLMHIVELPPSLLNEATK